MAERGYRFVSSAYGYEGLTPRLADVLDFCHVPLLALRSDSTGE